MGVSAQLICIAFFAILAVGFVSSQAANGTVADAVANSTATGSAGSAGTSGNMGKSTIQCYKCSSFLVEEHCDSINEQTPVVDCLPGEDMCRKVEQHITYKGDDQIRTYRECAKSGNLGECSVRSGTSGFKSWYCQCKGNLCNSAANSAISFTLLASMIAVFFCLKNRI